jgi:hypothetical protein
MGARGFFMVAAVVCLGIACGGQVERRSDDDAHVGSNTDQPDPPPPGSSNGGGFISDAAGTAGRPYGGGKPSPPPPVYVPKDGGLGAECSTRPALECKHCRNCDPQIDTQATFNALLKTCGRLCDDIIVDFDDTGCATRIYAEPNQQGLEANLECVIEELRQKRWSCGTGTSAWASFGHYCGK